MERRDAVKMAKEQMGRVLERAALIKKLRDEDMTGLECKETVELEKLSAHAAEVADALSTFLVGEDARDRTQVMEPALVWLNRRIRVLERASVVPTHADMAQAGVAYADRGKMIANAEKAADEAKGELEALRRITKFVEDRIG